MHIRGLLGLMGKKYTKAYILADTLFSLLYIPARFFSGFHVLYTITQEGIYSYVQVVAIYGVWTGSVMLIPSMIRTLKRYISNERKFVSSTKIITRNLEMTNENLSYRKQMSEYLKIGGAKHVKYWFKEIDDVDL